MDPVVLVFTLLCIIRAILAGRSTFCYLTPTGSASRTFIRSFTVCLFQVSAIISRVSSGWILLCFCLLAQPGRLLTIVAPLQTVVSRALIFRVLSWATVPAFVSTALVFLCLLLFCLVRLLLLLPRHWADRALLLFQRAVPRVLFQF